MGKGEGVFCDLLLVSSSSVIKLNLMNPLAFQLIVSGSSSYHLADSMLCMFDITKLVFFDSLRTNLLFSSRDNRTYPRGVSAIVDIDNTGIVYSLVKFD